MQRPRNEARIAEAKAIEAKAKNDAKLAAKGIHSQYDRERDPAYYAELDRQRMMRMDPP
jgi:hypothetical protein